MGAHPAHWNSLREVHQQGVYKIVQVKRHASCIENH